MVIYAFLDWGLGFFETSSTGDRWQYTTEVVAVSPHVRLCDIVSSRLPYEMNHIRQNEYHAVCRREV